MSVKRPEGLIEDAGRRGEPRRLDQMISARLDPKLVAALRKFAEAHGMSLSDVLEQSAFWDDLAQDLKDPRFLQEYVAESIRIATIDLAR